MTDELVRHRCYSEPVPTKRRRHAITETPPVQEALDELREELGDEQLQLSELVILGAREKLALLRAGRRTSTSVANALRIASAPRDFSWTSRRQMRCVAPAGHPS